MASIRSTVFEGGGGGGNWENMFGLRGLKQISPCLFKLLIMNGLEIRDLRARGSLQVREQRKGGHLQHFQPWMCRQQT